MAYSLPTSSINKLIAEFYVAWFNRVPDSEGFSYWVNELKKANDPIKVPDKLNDISNKFYNTAITQFSNETGYSSGMSDSAFITQLYDGVLDRTGVSAPEIKYWVDALNSFNGDKGALVIRMIREIKSNTSTDEATKAAKAKFINKVDLSSAIGSEALFNGKIVEGKAILEKVTEDRDSAREIINEMRSQANNTNQETANKFLAKNDSDSLLAQIGGVTYSDNDAIPDYLSFDIDTNNVNTDGSVDGDNIITFIGIDQNEIAVSDIV